MTCQRMPSRHRAGFLPGTVTDPVTSGDISERLGLLKQDWIPQL